MNRYQRITLHPSVQLAWAMANAEACASGSSFIELSHFLLAILKIVDNMYDQTADLMQFPPEAHKEIFEAALECRAALKMTDDEITAARRGIRKLLRAESMPDTFRVLHRSAESRYLLQKSVNRAFKAGFDEVNLLYVLEELLLRLPPSLVHFFPEQENTLDFEVSTIESAKHKDKVWDQYSEQTFEPDRHSSTIILDAIGRDLSALAKAGRLTPVVGRRAEITALARHLQRTIKRNVVVIGEAGVGKTAIVEGLAQSLADENAPDFLKALRIVQINVADLLSGTKYRGELEERVQGLIKEAVGEPNIVIFFDEIHLLMGGSGGGPSDMANILKPALSREDFRCIGATTFDEFEAHIKPDAAFMRRFQILRLDEPTIEEAIEICRKWASRIERLQQVVFTDDAIISAVELSVKFIRGRSLPDKAIDLLENAATFVKISSLSFSNKLPQNAQPSITGNEIKRVLEEQYDINVTAAELLDTEHVREVLKSKIIGQEEAINDICETLTSLANKHDTEKPLGVLLFAGPTGVGKTLGAECLARALFDSESGSLGRFNMSEYKERHELARLIGAPPGFIGHERQGNLFRYVETHPQGLILLDEVEKAHPEIQDYFLQILDKGEASDHRGNKVDFKRHLFVLTCNVLSEKSSNVAGFRADNRAKDESNISGVMSLLSQHFRPEFLARIDQVVVFNKLGEEACEEFIRKQFNLLTEKIEKQFGGIIELTHEAREKIIAACLRQNEGARGFNKIFESLLVSPLIQQLKAEPADKINIKWNDTDQSLVFDSEQVDSESFTSSGDVLVSKMTPVPRKDVAMLLIDIVSSSRIVQMEGDSALMKSVTKLKDAIQTSEQANKMSFLKFTGDGFLAVFDEVISTLDLARSLQSLSSINSIKLRMVIHYGSVKVAFDGDPVGVEVHRLFRIESLKDADCVSPVKDGQLLPTHSQIIITPAALNCLSEDIRLGFEMLGQFRLASFNEHQEIWSEKLI